MQYRLKPTTQRVLYPATIRYSKLGLTGLVGVGALLLILLVGWILDLGAERGEVREFGAYARANQLQPVNAIAEAARSRRFVFLADIYGAAGPKRLAMSAIEAISRQSGLDAVVVEVGSDQQPYLDSYFDRSPEDGSVLVSNPRTLRETGAGGREYLELYHRIWQLNQRLGADRRIQVIAADIENWPPRRALSTTDRARRYAERADTMVSNLHRELLGLSPRSRVLVFMSGLQALKNVSGQLMTGGTSAVVVPWFAARLEDRFPGEVFSVLVDSPGSSAPNDVVPYTGTRLTDEAKSALPGGSYALRVNNMFDFLSRPIRESTGPGFTFDILPRQYRLKDVSDLYVHLSN
jgi:hypothetical protein